ncbi:MAG: asparagine--tRNA ligase [Candidatus Fimadaptatus sp.]
MTTVKQLFAQRPASDIENVTISGWVRTLRQSKTFAFMEVNDGTFFKNLQVVMSEENLADYRELVKTGVGASVEVTGTLVVTPDMPQPFELRASNVRVVGASGGDYPLQKKRHTLEYLRTIAHLRPRANLFQCAFRIRSLISQAVHMFFAEKGFVYVHTPLITGSDCEGAGEMFQVTTLDLEKLPRTPEGRVDYNEDFFGKPVNLTVSGQLNVETYCMAFRNVYTFGPTFRAENSNTPRHAAEFWMIEPEIAFADLSADMDLEEEMVKYLINYVMTNAPEELDFLNQFVDKGLKARLTNVVSSDFARVSYTEAIEILKNSGREFEFEPYWGCDMQSEHERYLSETHFGRPVFVYDYPKEIKAFYMRLNDDGKTVAAADLLVPGIGELCGGSQREERLDVLERRMQECGMNMDGYQWYLDLRRWGSVPHSGFGMGLERMVMYATGVSNIRDVLPFPRTPRNADY